MEQRKGTSRCGKGERKEGVVKEFEDNRAVEEMLLR